jgi:hypothetical protein
MGLLIGEGSFSGDRRYPVIVIGMHVRHEPLLRWLKDLFPRSRLYGPYHYRGRHFMRWVARGKCLTDDVMPQLWGIEWIDPHVAGRIELMQQKYPSRFWRER